MATQRSRVRGVMDRETILLRGDLKNSHLLVIRKPSIIISSMYNATVESLLYKWRSTKQSLSQRIKGTELYKRAKPWYDSASFYLERDVESTHINVKTLQGPTIGFDCEGVDLGRYGTTCYIQIRDYTKGQTYLVDLLMLGRSAWETSGEDSATTLRTIFESPNMVKIIFDVRGDSDALYKDYKIKLAGVLDVQYLAMLGRPYYYPYRIGFLRTMNDAACLSPEELQEWQGLKNYRFDGGYSVFKKRPLPKDLKLYAINDVLGVNKLAAELTRSLTQCGLDLAFEWTQKEIEWTWQGRYYHLEARVPEGFQDCWKENINQSTNFRLGLSAGNVLEGGEAQMLGEEDEEVSG
ncbi:hypothetical protein LTR70_004943 [Exophiala xenobiotica]|uniref:3'-5' exonuclease domain-containing protein n=1 Tax=Lithohypha guttulata TaxID=1690604 RepID=A0ABR0KCN2_9EURO|nr:hypothetical protein LTR24_004525 [Lithohypha guttulata]KAK5319759.1 hypothetical protein LTR70_004943 [Exophiala xenobiotica]